MSADYKRTFTGTVAVLAMVWATVWAPAAGANSGSTFDCIIQPTEFVELSSSVPGIIDTITVDRSDPVETGQEVARLRSEVEQAQVDLSKQRAGFDSEIESKRASLSFARRSQARTQKLFNKKAVPFHVLDEAKTDAILAATALRTAQQNKRMAELELARAQATLARDELIASVGRTHHDRLHHAVAQHALDQPLHLDLVEMAPGLIGIVQNGVDPNVAQIAGGFRRAGTRIGIIVRSPQKGVETSAQSSLSHA